MIISIITVVFNGEGTIGRAVESVLSQKNVQVEYIVIDGESTDKTMEVLSPYGSYIAKIISEKDEGIYDAMNKGLKIATGDVVGFLNADDFYSHPEILLRIAEEFRDQAVEAVFGDLDYFHQDNPTKIVRSYRSNKFPSKNLSRGLMPAHPTLFLKKAIYKKFGYFDSSFRIAGDFDFIVRVFKGGEINYRYLPESFVKMQLGGISTKGLSSRITVLRENMRACKKNGISTTYLKLVSRYPQKLLEYFFRK